MKKYKLRIKPQKCVIWVSSGKLLGHIISRIRIEVDPKKIKAITKMSTHQGKIQLINKIAPMSRLLMKEVEFKWDVKCQEAFDRIKEYLLHPSILAPYRHGEPLSFYVSTMECAFGVMLEKKKEDGKEKVIYFISKTLKEYEMRYTPIEKLC